MITKEIYLEAKKIVDAYNKQLYIDDFECSADHHAKQIIKKLTMRPHLEDVDGFYDLINDEIQMIKIVKDYISKNCGINMCNRG